MFLYRVIQALDSFKVPYAIAGGYAVALHGAVRGTVDVDLVIHLRKKDFTQTEEAMASIGLQPRLPIQAEQVFNFREEFIRERNLIAWSFCNPKRQLEVVDILITHDLKQMKTKSVRANGLTIRLVALKDLIQMKTQSGRPQDLADIDALKRLAK